MPYVNSVGGLNIIRVSKLECYSEREISGDLSINKEGIALILSG